MLREPALFSNHLGCSCPEHFAEAGRGKTECCQGQKVSPGGWAMSHSPDVFYALLLKFQRTKPFLATTAHKGLNTAFQLLGGIYGGRPQTALQRETGGFTVLGCDLNRNRQRLAKKILS